MKAYHHQNGPDNWEVPHARCRCGGRFTYCEIINDPTCATCERCHSAISVEHINTESVATDIVELKKWFDLQKLRKILTTNHTTL